MVAAVSCIPNPLQVLFVDDEPNVLRGLQRMLFQHAHEWDMYFAGGGAEALAIMDQQPVDVLVTDMRMPGMDGARLLELVHDQHPGVARIVLSGHTEVEAALRALPIAHQFLSKPCPAVQLKTVLTRTAALRTLVGEPHLQCLLGALSGLPARPRVFFELARLLANEDTPLGEVSKLVAEDVGIAAKVLHVVNTAFFAGSQRITRIEDAVPRLGLNVLKAIVLSAEVSKDLRVPSRLEPMIDALTLQSQRVARVAQQLARQAGVDEKDVDLLSGDLFTAGLLHDVGILVLAGSSPEQLEAVLNQTREAGCSRLEAELLVLRTTHADLGAYLLSLWGLPYVISEAVALHHRPELLQARGPDCSTLLWVAHALVDEAEGHRPKLEEAEVAATGVSLNLENARRSARRVVGG